MSGLCSLQSFVFLKMFLCLKLSCPSLSRYGYGCLTLDEESVCTIRFHTVSTSALQGFCKALSEFYKLCRLASTEGTLVPCSNLALSYLSVSGGNNENVGWPSMSNSLHTGYFANPCPQPVSCVHTCRSLLNLAAVFQCAVRITKKALSSLRKKARMKACAQPTWSRVVRIV